MNEWKSYKLSDFFEINPKVSLKSGESYSFVEMKDLDESRKFTKPAQMRKLTGGARFQENDTLFARITPCLENGKICQVKELKNGVGFGSTEFLVFRGKENLSDTNFVFYLARYPIVRSFAEQNLVGTSGRQRVSKEAFDKIKLPLPPLTSQKAIAEILSSLDDKIELNNQINENLEALAQAIFKRWFVDFEFPDENGNPYKSSGGSTKETELGSIPENWCVKTIGELSHCVTKGDTPMQSAIGAASKNERLVNLVRVNAITENGEIISDKLTQIPESIHLGKSKRSILKEGYILYTNAGTIGRVAFVGKEILPANTNQAIAIIQPDNSIISSEFLYMIVRQKEFQDNLHSNVTQSVQQNLALGEISKAKFVFPSIDILSRFSTIIASLLTTIRSFREESKDLTKLREIILPKLISGKLSIPEI